MSEVITVDTGKRIKSRRMQLHVSQEDLAAAIGTGQKQIWRYENGKNSPTAEVIIAIARTLDVSSDWLLGLTDEIKPFSGSSDLTDIEIEMIHIMRSKTKENQRKLVDIARVV